MFMQKKLKVKNLSRYCYWKFVAYLHKVASNIMQDRLFSGEEHLQESLCTAVRIAEKAIKNPYVLISYFIIIKMVIPGIFGVAESDSVVKIVITLLFDLIMLFEVNYGIKFWKINTDSVFMIAKAIEHAETGKSIICINLCDEIVHSLYYWNI